MKIILILVGALVLVSVLIYAMGAALPVKHLAENSRPIPANATQVAAWIRDVAKQPAWRSDLKKVEVLAMGPPLHYRETSKNGVLEFMLTEPLTNARFESNIVPKEGQPFGGRWTINIEPTGETCKVTIREDGEVYSAIFRFFSKYIFGHDTTMRAYLDALDARAKRGR